MTKPLDCVLDHVHKLIGTRRESEICDGELLARFVGRQDESAFETLVRRHGPMVLRTCRRALGNAHAAEDAFQATFLVLARKAGSIRNRESIGGWLYEVAYHLAIRARADAVRRERHERQAQDMATSETNPEEEGEENREALQAMVDEELHRLPEKYRTPLVLCYVEGKTNTQAARELGWPAGSMSSRLARAREMLRDRLAGRGIALSAGGVALLLTENAVSAAVPAVLLQNTVQAATLYAAGQTSLVGLVSGKAIVLAEGMLNTMITTKLKLVAALLLAVTLLGTGSSFLVQQGGAALAGQNPVAAEKKSDAPAADGKKADVYGDPLPDGALARMGTLRWRHGGAVGFVGFTDGGKQLLTNSTDGLFHVWDVATGKEIRKFGGALAQQANVNGGVMIQGNVAFGVVGTTIGGQTNAVLAPDGITLAAASQNDTGVHIWDVSTGKELRSFNPNTNQAQRVFAGNLAMCFSGDSKQLAVRSIDQAVKLFDVAEGKEIRTVAKPDPKKQVYFYGGSNTSLAFAPDGKTLATMNTVIENQRQVGLVVFWDVEKAQELRQVKAEADNFGAIGSIAYSPDGKTLAWSRYDGVVRLLDPTTGKEMQKLGTPQQGIFHNTLLFSADGKTLATRSINSPTIQLWNLADGKEIRSLGDVVNPQQAGFVRVNNQAGSIAFSPDGKTLAEGLPTNTVRLWEVSTGKEILPVVGHQGGVSSMSVSPDGKTLTTFGSDNTLRRWDMVSGKEVKSIKLPAGSSIVALSGDGKLALVGQMNNAVGIWDVDAGKELRTLNVAGQQNFPGWVGGQNGMAVSPDGKIAAVRGFDANIRIFETATGAEKNPLGEQPVNGPNGVAINQVFYGGRTLMVFSPDGNTLATLGNTLGQQAGLINRPVMANNNTIIRLWNVQHGKGTGRIDIGNRGISAMVFSPDGFSIATANSDNTVSLWEVATGKECLKFPLVKKEEKDKPAAQPAPQPGVAKPALAIARAPMINQGNITSLAISADGRTLAAGSNDRTLYLFDLATGDSLGKFTGHEGSVLNVLFARDNRTLISGSADTTAMVWDGGRYIKDAPQSVDLSAAQLDQLWKDLGGEGETFYKALGTLARSPTQSVAMFGQKVKPAAGVEAKKIDQLIKDLDSNVFDTREKAADELEKLGELAKPALDKVLESQPSLETQQRIERLKEKLVTGQPPPADVLRGIRAVRVLQLAGTSEAKQLLRALADGAPGDKLTVEAQAALKRLK